MQSAILSQWMPRLFGLTDEQAMWQVQSRNDSRAFSLLVERWSASIEAICVRMTGDSHRAQDIAQETFARLFTHRRDYRPTAPFSAFIRKIAINLCYDELRRIQRRKECSLEEADGDGPCPLEAIHEGAPSPDAALDARERAESVRQALLKLPEGHRSVIVLRHYENLKFREIAAVLDIPEGTVKSRMADALSMLNRFLAASMRDANHLQDNYVNHER
jgi:RNA polymerase sigma-70 factor (ECF subfamily)